LVVRKKPQKTESDDILKRATPVADVGGTLSCIFYGRSGTGKTTLSSSFPGDVILLDFKEEGTDSIRDVPGVFVLPINSWTEVEDVYWSLKDGNHNFKTVVIDTISGLQDLAVLDVKEQNGASPDSAVSQRMWGEVGSKMKEWIFNYRDLPMNVVFLAHERVKEPDSEDILDEGQLDPEVGPNVIPSVSKTLCAAVKIIGNTYVRQSFIRSKKTPGKTRRKVEYCLRVGPHPFYTTKIRTPKSNVIPESIPDASYEKLMQIMNGNYQTRAVEPQEEK